MTVSPTSNTSRTEYQQLEELTLLDARLGLETELEEAKDKKGCCLGRKRIKEIYRDLRKVDEQLERLQRPPLPERDFLESGVAPSEEPPRSLEPNPVQMLEMEPFSRLANLFED